MLVESKKNKKAIRKNPLGRPKVTCTSPSNGGAKIQINPNSAIANLQQLLPKYNSQSSLKGLKTNIRRALGLPEKEGPSDYGVFVIEDNGASKECSIRISNHNANAGNYEGRESDTNISIKMRSRVNKNTFKPHKDIELMEYTYFDYLLVNVEQPIQKIILSIIEYLSNGIYDDKTGVALRNASPQQANNTENNQTIGINTITDNNGTTREATKWTHGADDVVNENNRNRKMNKKQTIRLNESQLNNLVKKVVNESVKQLLNEVEATKSEILEHEIEKDLLNIVNRCETLSSEALKEGDNLRSDCASILRNQLKKAMEDYYDGINGYYEDQIKHNFTLP